MHLRLRSFTYSIDDFLMWTTHPLESQVRLWIPIDHIKASSIVLGWFSHGLSFSICTMLCHAIIVHPEVHQQLSCTKVYTTDCTMRFSGLPYVLGDLGGILHDQLPGFPLPAAFRSFSAGLAYVTSPGARSGSWSTRTIYIWLHPSTCPRSLAGVSWREWNATVLPKSFLPNGIVHHYNIYQWDLQGTM